MTKKILLVAMPDSIHTARWINQIQSPNWTIHLFSSTPDETLHPDILASSIHIHFCLLTSCRNLAERCGLRSLGELIDSARKYLERFFPGYRASRLRDTIEKISPDIIHSLEIQHSGYLTLAARASMTEKFPKWIVTNWGSDIHLFGRLSQHRQKIRLVLESCDYYSCECKRDVYLSEEFGFKNTVLPVLPNAGGFDLVTLERLRRLIPTSERKVILLKGYQNWAGRALFGLRALENCADILSGYTVTIYSPSPDLIIAAELFTGKTGIATKVISRKVSHFEMMSLHAEARLSIGLSISDAISTSLLEAMVMGSFPIQSCTACADEWIVHGISGMIVPPEEPAIIESAIRAALLDDVLVNSASETNWQTAVARLDSKSLKPEYDNIYHGILFPRESPTATLQSK